jgi:hypothetical protein
MEVMVVLSKYSKSRDAKKMEKLILKNIGGAMINISEEIEVFLKSDEKVYTERLKKIAADNGYEMEVIK